MKFRTQMLLLQVGVVLLVVFGAGAISLATQEQRIRSAYEDRMISVARSVAALPSVRDALGRPGASETIQPLAELIRESSGVTYVVVTDAEGIRQSHPNPDLIGELVSTDPSEVLAGQMYTGTQTGSLGRSWRVKLPIRDDAGATIGMASVGILESELRGDLLDDLPGLVAWLAGAAALGMLLAGWVSGLVWRRIHRLEPEEIAGLLHTKEAILDGISEGVIALDPSGRVALANREARDLLGLADDVVGHPAAEVLDPTLLHFLDVDTDEDSLVLAGERVLLVQRRKEDTAIGDESIGEVMILRDRTELRETLRSLDGARDIAAALRAQSHEFSNKMHVVAGLLELGRTEEAAKFINRGTGASVTAQITAPGIDDLELTGLLLQKGHLGAERGIRVVVDPTSTHRAEGNSDVLTVVANLVDNALEAVGSDGTVEVELHAEDEGIRIVVSDDGPGLGTADPHAIFEVGVTTKSHRDGRARGIGLALVSRITERREGVIEAGERPGGGTTVEVFLSGMAPVRVGARR